MIIIQIILILFYSQQEQLTFVDYDTNEIVHGVMVFSGDKKISESNLNGTVKAEFDENVNYELRYIGYHEIIASGKELMKIDTIYLFSYKATYAKRHSDFKKSPHIKKNKIMLIKDNMKYEYLYDKKNTTLKLNVKTSANHKK